MNENSSGPSSGRSRGPLSYQVFFAIWLAAIFSYTGTWVQDVAESWSMGLLRPKDPGMVALVVTCNAVPGFLLMLPAGALSDRFDRRKIILLSQTWMAVMASLLAVLAHFDRLSPTAILFGSAALGIGNAMTIPAWQTLLPELVPRNHMADAVTLNSVAFNIARSLGPALGGFIVSLRGPAPAFAVNALSFLAVIEVVRRYPEVKAASEKRRWKGRTHENVVRAILTAVRYAQGAPHIKALYLATAVFTVAAAPIPALLLVFAKDALHTDSRGYGLLLGMLGAGAVASAFLLKRIRHLVPARLLLVGAMALHGLAVVAMTCTTKLSIAAVCYFFAGMGWIPTYTTLNSLVQLTSPRRVKSRTMALYHVAYLGTFSIGSSLGGALASGGLGVTLTVRAAAVAAIGAGALTSFLAIPSYSDDAEKFEEMATPLPAE